ncbi:hypothetical protein QTP88_017783 [Uroleucon formosanum]
MRKILSMEKNVCVQRRKLMYDISYYHNTLYRILFRAKVGCSLCILIMYLEYASVAYLDIKYLIIIIISPFNTAYREIKRLFPSEWKRASNLGGRLMCQLDSRNCGGFFVGKKFVGYSMFDNNYGKMRKNSKTEPKIDNYEDIPYNSRNYIKWHH